MARGGKYPTPDEVVAKYKRSITMAKDKWEKEAIEKADKDFFIWYSAFAATVYDTIARLPARTDKYEENVVNRVIPVVGAIKELAAKYRAVRVAAASERSRKAKEKAEAVLGIKF